VSTTTPTFTWSTAPGGTTAPAFYDIWVDEVNPTTGATIMSQRIRMYVSGSLNSWTVGNAGTTPTAFTPAPTSGGPLTSGKTYRYWIAATSTKGTEVWSVAYYFKT
jgi:hypothetical protein